MADAPSQDFAYERLGVNSLLAERYQLVRYIGEGAAGSVYFAHDLLLDNRPVAVKVLHVALAQNGPALDRLRREVEITQGLSHPGLVQVYTFEPVTVGEDSRPTAMLVMEYVEGSTLRQILDHGALMEDEALALFQQLVEALAFVHERGIVHRDIKPENIIVTKDGLVKLTDFGLAKRDAAMDMLTQSGQVLGTPGYMAPELYRGAPATPTSDVYSLGLVLYEMCVGEQLQRSEQLIAQRFTRESGRIRRALRSLGLRRGEIALILNLCCAAEPEGRPGSAIELQQQLTEPLTFARRVRGYQRSRGAAALLRSTGRVVFVLVCVFALTLLYLGRIVSPYSIAHLNIATYLDAFQFTRTGGLLGIAPLDGIEYIRQRTAYGLSDVANAGALGAEGRTEMLMCGLEHRLTEFAQTLRPGFEELAVGLVRSCALYPLAEPLHVDPPMISPLAVVARIGDSKLFEEILQKVSAERISEVAIEQTLTQAVRMNREEMVSSLIRSHLFPTAVRDGLLIEVLMSGSDSIFEQLLATGIPFTLTPEYLAERMRRPDTPNKTRWGRLVERRVRQAERRMAVLLARRHDFSAARQALDPIGRTIVAASHPDLIGIFLALDIDWNTPVTGGMTPLLTAMTDSTNPIVPFLIGRPEFDVNVRNEAGMNALGFAIGKYRSDWIRHLARRGADMNLPITLNKAKAPLLPPLRILAPSSLVGLVDALLESPDLDLTIGPNLDVTPLGLSIGLASSKTTELLLKRGVDPNQIIAGGQTALHVAAATGTARHVQLLLERGANPNMRGKGGETPLMLAVTRGNDVERPRIITALLRGGADPAVRAASGLTPYTYALMPLHSRAIGELLDATRTEPFMTPDGTRLFEYTRARPMALGELLIRMRIDDIDSMCRFRLYTALGYLAAVTARPKLPKTLLDAVKERDFDTVVRLLANGADPLMGDIEGSTFHHASLRDRELFHLLISYRPFDPNRVQPGHFSPLQIAARAGDLPAVEELLSIGADPLFLDEQGNPVLIAAYASGNRAVIERIRRAAPDAVKLIKGLPHSRRGLEEIFGVPE